MARAAGFPVAAIHGATRSTSFGLSPSSAQARRCASTVAPLSMARVIVILVAAIPGATHPPSFSTGPAIHGRSFAPARAVLGLDAMRRPSLTHPWPVVRSCPSSARARRCASTVAHPTSQESPSCIATRIRLHPRRRSFGSPIRGYFSRCAVGLPVRIHNLRVRRECGWR